jgi:hypothetical protein
MKTLVVRDNDHTIVTMHQPEGITDKEFEELSMSLLLTLANLVGRPLIREDLSS